MLGELLLQWRPCEEPAKRRVASGQQAIGGGEVAGGDARSIEAVRAAARRLGRRAGAAGADALEVGVRRCRDRRRGGKPAARSALVAGEGR